MDKKENQFNKTYKIMTNEQEIIELIKDTDALDNLLIQTGEKGFKKLSQAIYNSPGVVLTSLEEVTGFASGKDVLLIGYENNKGDTIYVGELKIDPSFDDRMFNKRLHPDGGLMSSYRYVVSKEILVLEL